MFKWIKWPFVSRRKYERILKRKENPMFNWLKRRFVSRQHHERELQTAIGAKDYWQDRAMNAESLLADRTRKLNAFRRLLGRIEKLNINDTVRDVDSWPGE
jgi:hypothetical protein